MESIENTVQNTTSVKDAVKAAVGNAANKSGLMRGLARAAIIIVIMVSIAALACAGIFGTAFYHARANAINRDEAINLAKSHLESNEIVPEPEKLFVNDVEYDLEVEILGIRDSYLVYVIEFGKPDESRIFVDVNARTGACSLKRISPAWWEAVIPD